MARQSEQLEREIERLHGQFLGTSDERRSPTDNSRGRSATTPSDMPARGWKDILLRMYEGISADRILANAAGVTFYALLAIFPGIAALVSIYGLFADPTTIASNLDAVSDVMPGGAVEVVRDQVNRIAAQGAATLGISFLAGLVSRYGARMAA